MSCKRDRARPCRGLLNALETNTSSIPASRTRFARLAAALLIVAHAAYGCDNGLAECTLDSDCDQGQACEVSACVPECGGDGDCLDGEVCVQGLTTEQRVCRDDMMSSTNPDVRSRFALIRDMTEDDGCADGLPGSDIAFVLLEDQTGNVQGWGRAVSADIQAEGNDFSAVDHVDGTRPEAGADSCPDVTQDNLVSLGCGGWIAVEFVNAEQEPVEAKSGEHWLRVGEYGAQCDDGDELDKYEVLLCPDAATEQELPERCTIPLGVGTGERAFGF